MELQVVTLPAASLAYRNTIFMHLDDFVSLVKRTPQGVTNKDKIRKYGLNVVCNGFVFAAKPLKEIEEGTVGMSSLQRQTVSVALKDYCEFSVFQARSDTALCDITFELLFLTRDKESAKIIDVQALTKQFETQFPLLFCTVGQLHIIDYGGSPLRMKVMSLQVLNDESETNIGQFIPGTVVKYTKGKDQSLKLTNQSSSGGGKKIFKADFDFTKLGIGGLDEEFNAIFRRAFASRVFPANLVKLLGIHHVRGMLLFGPPGCGKTLIARQIGKVLTAAEPKVVNGPEILDKFVGESERKIRDLFADARKDQEENGDDSDLHIIIFDEIDAVCKARGSSGGGTGVGDSVVNQLLTQIDGVDSLNNVLVIGMTNRKDMLDEALLRPGRLEVQMEINLPDEFGRGQILTIHTEKARENGYLSKEVIMDLDSCLKKTENKSEKSEKKTDEKTKALPNLAQRTKNFSGAEIAGLVRAATAHALSRGTEGAKFTAVKDFKPSIELKDFDLAMTEVQPKFGAPSGELSHLYRNGIIDYGPEFSQAKDSLHSILEQVRTNDSTSVMSVLLHGDAGTGKTALAASTAVLSEFPLVRIISASDMIGVPDVTRCETIYQTFQEAYRSPFGIIIIDDMERVLDYVNVGPRFSNPILQALLVMIKNPPPVPERKLLIIGITSAYDDLEELGLTKVFDMQVQLSNLTSVDSIRTVLQKSGVPIPKPELSRISTCFTNPIPIKKLLMTVEMASQDCDTVTEKRVIECIRKFKL